MTTPLFIDAAIAAADATPFPGFRPFRQMANGVKIAEVTGGSGPPLPLLHGHPQSHMTWHKVTRGLVYNYMAVATDLRGYGASSKPAGSVRHAEYSKRTTVQDQVEVTRVLGFGRFRPCAHDRGARVAHWLCVGHPLCVEHATLLGIAPTLAMYEHTDMAFASAYWRRFFLIQLSPPPKTLINATPDFYIGELIGLRHTGLGPSAPEAMATYAVAIREPACAYAMCEDYHVVATIDLEHDRADRDVGKRASVPLRVLWGGYGVIQRCFKPLELWKAVTDNVSDGTVPCGHYAPEEALEASFEEMRVYSA